MPPEWVCPDCGGTLAYEREACLCGGRAQRSAPQVCEVCGGPCEWTAADETALQATLVPLTPQRAYLELLGRLPCP